MTDVIFLGKVETVVGNDNNSKNYNVVNDSRSNDDAKENSSNKKSKK